MKLCSLFLIAGLLCCFSRPLIGAEAEKALTPKNEYEREISAVVRNKIYYRAGSFEFGVGGGMLPYESVMKSMMLNGRLTFHISDSIGWEIADFQYHFPSIGNFLTNTLNSQPQITRLENVHPLKLASTNLLITPFYGKIRIAGSWAVYLDFYTVVGFVFGENRTMRFANADPDGTAVRTNWDPGFNLGLGFRFYFNRSLALTFDMRNSTLYTRFYDRNQFRSYFSTTLGFSFFLPSTG